MSPQVWEEAGFRFRFVMADLKEPPHVHAHGDKGQAKFWLAPVRLARAGGLTGSEVARAMRVVKRMEDYFLERWREERVRAGY